MVLPLIVLCALQLLAATFGDTLRVYIRCGLRSPSGGVLSDFVSRTVLSYLLHANIRVPAHHCIID